MKWSGTFSNAVDGSSGDGNGGTYCWTSNAGMRASSPPTDGAAFTTAHGTSLAGTLKQWTAVPLKARLLLRTSF